MLFRNMAADLGARLYYGLGWVRASILGVRLSGRCRVSPSAKVRGAAFLGDVVIGSKVAIGKGSYINSGIVADARIGDYCSIGYGVAIGLTEHIPDNWTTSPYEAREAGLAAESTTANVPPPIIHDGVWIGAHVVILRGVCVGAGSIIAAGAVVTSDVPPYEIWGGVPARKIRSRKVTGE